MKITFFSIFVVVILQATSVINLTHIYQTILGKYGNNFERIVPKTEGINLNPSAMYTDKQSSLDIRF
jgi:hypothetical protein